MKVRIAVGINERGEYEAIGEDGTHDDSLAEDVLGFLSCRYDDDDDWPAEHVVFVEADVPLPEPKQKVVVEGVVAQ